MAMDLLDQLCHTICSWLQGTGPESDIVISSRVRLARNLVRFPFTSRANEHDKREIFDFVRERLQSLEPTREFHILAVDELPQTDQQFLVERQLISRELQNGSGARGVAFDATETTSLMINEEDHLRLQVMQSGLALREAWDRANTLDDALDSVIDFAYHPEFGYLTACPTNVGTGLRASVMLHLPALAMTKQMDKVVMAMEKMGLAVRGLFGEGSQPSGDFYQISNQVTLGRSEEDIIEEIYAVIPKLIQYERRAREALLSESRNELQDSVSRSLGILGSAHTITSEETMYHLSRVRLGIALGLIDLPTQTVNKLFMQTQPAHLQKLQRQELSGQERNVVRAALLRQRLASATQN